MDFEAGVARVEHGWDDKEREQHLLRARGANLFHLGDGRVTRLVLHFDREHALADLGLRG